jgi:hypothetical protein
MSFFVKTTPAPEPRTSNSLKVSILYAIILTAAAVIQLFNFEDFISFIQSLNLPFGMGLNYAFLPLMVVAQVFALPYLLRMDLSPAFRYVSLFLSLLAAALWIFLACWVVLSGQPTISERSGSLVSYLPGAYAIFITLAVGVLAIWSAWGLWPGRRKQ